jgi:predicted XRE-type DNA-binding protein
MPNSKNIADKRQNKKVLARGHQFEQFQSSGSVFKDMGKDDAEANSLLMRSKLMIAIEETIQGRGWTQSEAAKVIGVARPRIAELCAGRIDLFSVDTLIKYLNKLGKQVTLVIKDNEVG